MKFQQSSNSEFLLTVVVILVLAFVVGRACRAEAQASMDPLPNRVNLIAGLGPDGLAVSQPSNGDVEVTPYYGPLVGLQYERDVYGPVSAGMIVLGGPSRQSRTFVWAWSLGYSW